MEAALAEAMEWMEEQDGGGGRTAEKEDYEEKLREVEEVCGPIIKQVYEKTGGGSAGAEDEDDVNELSAVLPLPCHRECARRRGGLRRAHSSACASTCASAPRTPPSAHADATTTATGATASRGASMDTSCATSSAASIMCVLQPMPRKHRGLRVNAYYDHNFISNQLPARELVKHSSSSPNKPWLPNLSSPKPWPLASSSSLLFLKHAQPVKLARTGCCARLSSPALLTMLAGDELGRAVWGHEHARGRDTDLAGAEVELACAWAAKLAGAEDLTFGELEPSTATVGWIGFDLGSRQWEIGTADCWWAPPSVLHRPVARLKYVSRHMVWRDGLTCWHGTHASRATCFGATQSRQRSWRDSAIYRAAARPSLLLPPFFFLHLYLFKTSPMAPPLAVAL
nr:unnamed protein product [Digitaria exilis]